MCVWGGAPHIQTSLPHRGGEKGPRGLPARQAASHRRANFAGCCSRRDAAESQRASQRALAARITHHCCCVRGVAARALVISAGCKLKQRLVGSMHRNIGGVVWGHSFVFLPYPPWPALCAPPRPSRPRIVELYQWARPAQRGCGKGAAWAWLGGTHGLQNGPRVQGLARTLGNATRELEERKPGFPKLASQPPPQVCRCLPRQEVRAPPRRPPPAPSMQPVASARAAAAAATRREAPRRGGARAKHASCRGR